MKPLLTATFFLLSLSTALATPLPTTDSQLYQAMDDLAEYVSQKDPSLNKSQLYYKILENSESYGLSAGLIKPLNSLYLLENNGQKAKNLQRIFLQLGLAVPPKTDNSQPHNNPRRNINIVANSGNECIGSCIRDILDSAAKGAGIGTAIGAAGGPATAGAGAAGGAIIGGALGGAACSTRPECNKDDKKNKIIVPPTDLDKRGPIDVVKIKRKRDIVINPGLRLTKEN